MFQFVLVIALGYFIYKFATDLYFFEGPWKMAQYAELVMLILSVPLFIYTSIRAVKQYKVDQVKREEEMEKERIKQAEKKRQLYLQDDLDQEDVAADDIGPDDTDLDDFDVDESDEEDH